MGKTSGYKYEAGVQGYVNACKSSGQTDTRKGNTTFQRRGYLSIKCGPDVIISRSTKSIDEQIIAIADVKTKHGSIDESGAVRGMTKLQELYTDARYMSEKELSDKTPNVAKGHGEFHGKPL